MKFRKSVSSPKMELLSRRSTTNDDKMSTLKRSRSFRASVKLISKIRNRAAFKFTSGIEISPMSSKDYFKTIRSFSSKDSNKIQQQQQQQQESSRICINTKNKFEKEKSICKKKDTKKKENICQDDRQGILSETNSFIGVVESCGITKDFEKKLSLGDKINVKNRICLEKSCERRIEEETKSPKVVRIFRRKIIPEDRSKKNNDQEFKVKGKIENDVCGYENPMFSLDSSLDSSFVSIEMNMKNEEHITREKCFEPVIEKTNLQEEQRHSISLLSCKSDLKYVRSFSMKEERSFERDKSPGEKRNNRPRTNFYSESEINNSPKLRDKYLSDYVSSVDSSTESVYSSKSCKNRTVDNLTNFWSNARGGSFRSKMSSSKKKHRKESKDLESIGQDRVLVTTTSGSSTLDRTKAFH